MVSSSARARRLGAISRLYLTDYDDDEDDNSDDKKEMTMTLTIAAMTMKVRMQMKRGMTMLNLGKVVHN